MRQRERRRRKERNDKRRDNLGISETRNGEEKAHTNVNIFFPFLTRDGWKRVDERAKTQKEKQINNKEEEEGKTFVVGGEIKVYVQPNSKRR